MVFRGRYLNNFLSSGQSLDNLIFFKSEYDEPTYLGFRVEFKFDDVQIGVDYDRLPEGLLMDENKNYSAIKYLKNIGYKDRSDNLKVFRKMLLSIQNDFPFYIQSISNVSELIKVDVTKLPNRFKDTKLEISFLEGIDLRIYSMFDLYKKSIFDEKYYRILLPDIMRYFTMYIYVYEIRNFNKPIKTKNGIDSNNSDNEYFLKSFNEHISVIKFTLTQCEFDLSSIKTNWSENLSNDTKDPADFKISIKVGRVKEVASYPIIEGIARSIVENFSYLNFYGENLSKTKGGAYGSNIIKSSEFDGGNTYNDLINKLYGYGYSIASNETPNDVYNKTPYKKITSSNFTPNVYTDEDYLLDGGHLRDNNLRQSPTIIENKKNEESKKDSKAKEVINSLSSYFKSQFENFIKTQINNFALGNVYGISPNTLIGLLNDPRNIPAYLLAVTKTLENITGNQNVVSSFLGSIYNGLPRPSQFLNFNNKENSEMKLGEKVLPKVKDGFKYTASDENGFLGKPTD